MKTNAVGFAVAMISVFVGFQTLADDAKPTTPPPPESKAMTDHKGRGKGGGMMAELGLSSNQMAEVKQKMEDTRKDMTQLDSAREAARADLEKLVTVETLDEKAILAAGDKLAQIHADITRLQIRSRLDIAKLLTPEQRKTWNETHKGMKERGMNRGGGRGKGMGMGAKDKATPKDQFKHDDRSAE